MERFLLKRGLHKWQMKYAQHKECTVPFFIKWRNNHTYFLFILISILYLSGCSSKENYLFQDSDEAVHAYNNLLQQIRLHDRASIDLILDLVYEWRTLSDSVSACINRDSIDNKNYHTKSAYSIIGDSIIFELERLIDSSPRNFKDYYCILNKLSSPELPKEVRNLVASAHQFFHSMDSVTIPQIDKRHTILLYENTLDSALSRNIHSKQDILHFLKSEDIAFRLFLSHLSSWGDMSLDHIKVKTQAQIKSIFESITKSQEIMSKSEIVILMTMRNNRRLLQNATTCVTDVHILDFKDNNQATAYLWMLLQPWLSIDGFCYTLLSQEEKISLEKLAAEMPQAFRQLESGHFPIDLNELPPLLIKAYIDNLYTTSICNKNL